MNHLIEFADNNRTTTHFRDSAILEIRIAYRIMEYLAPDETFPPKIDPHTKSLMLMTHFSSAFDNIGAELDADGINTDLGCSLAFKKLRTDAIELMKHLLPIYQQNCHDAKEKRKMALLQELKELES